MANEYDIEDLYGKYDNGEEGVTLNALQAIIANLIVDSANIRDGAIKNAHIESLNARKIYSVGGATSDTNIALGKTISSNTAEDATHPWSKLNDGTKVKGTANYAGFGTGSTGAEVNYIQYDLGTSYRLAESKIYFYAMDNRYYRYKIKYSEDGQNWYYAVGDANTWAKSVPANLGGSTMNPTKNTFPMPIVARYVRLYADGNSVNAGNHVDEWELFSYEQTTIEGGMLRANTVIADDIVFTGTLQGADGTFSGTVEINQGGNQFVASLIDSALTMSYNVPTERPWANVGYDGMTVRDQATTHYMRYRKNGIELYDSEMNLGSGGTKAYINFVSTAVDTGYIDIVPARTISGLYGNIAVSRDEWLRLNDGGDHTNGVYFGSSVVRTDGQFQLGGSGTYLLADSSAITLGGTSGAPLQLRGKGTVNYMAVYDTAGVRVGVVGKGSSTDNSLFCYADNGVVYLYGGCMINTQGSNARWQRTDQDYIYQSSSFVGLYFGGAIKHTFRSDGTKSGGSIEVDGKNLGMSPIDSPQILLEYVKFGITLTTEGARVDIDPTFLKTVAHFDVFPSRGEIVEVGIDYFIIKGAGTASCRIIGERIGQAGKFYEDLDLLTAENEQPALSK